MLFVCNRQDVCAAGFYFLDVADGFLQNGFLGGQGNHRNAFFDQRQGAVLQFARSVSFGVNVGDLFQLQRAFLSNSVINAAANEEQVLMLSDLLSVGFNRFFLRENLFYLLWQGLHSGQNLSDLCFALSTAYFCQIQTKQRKCDNL
ncbi:hypothetical protein D3C73_1166910 [compost metagenome]